MQNDLFNSDEYPDGSFKKLHPVFKGIAEVPQHKFTSSDPFEVNLNSGECSCPNGAALVWYRDQKIAGKWITNRYCVHKLKAMADLIQENEYGDDTEIMFAFFKAVATRYNSFEVVSAFHKYLRVGKYDMAYFFACILATTRSAKGIIKYLTNIIYEETRDHDLRRYLATLQEQPDRISLLDMAKAIMWFCETPKKWDLHEVRIPLFYHEMRGYQRLVKEFGEDVAKASEIIDADMVPVFLAGIEKAIATKDWDYLQYCVKGIQKSKFPKGVTDLHELRTLAIKQLHAQARSHLPKPRYLLVKRFASYLANKPAKIGISYHDLNAFADIISGEPLNYGCLSLSRQAEIHLLQKPPAFPFEKFPAIPLVAHDNHTYRGKALLRSHWGQVPFGIEQDGFDLRGCGAYHGVSWRYHAAAQGGIKQPWHKVKAPKWVADLTLKLFY